MKYYVVEVATTADGTAKDITEQDTRNHAEMQFHQVMASMLANDAVLVGFCSVIDGMGRQMPDCTKYYAKPIENPIQDAE